ncbi:hypothetical protein T484DRAFT_1936272, partial [Baffinella frigidus]
MSRSLLRAAAPVLARPAAPALQSSRVLAGHVAALRHSPHEGAAARSLSTSAFPRAATLPAQRALWHPEYARPLSSVAAAQQAAPAAPAVPPVMDRAPPTPASQEKAPEMPPIDGAVKKPKAKRVRKALMTVSNNAVMRLTELFSEKDHPPAGIRLGVRTRGCNGLSYTMNYVDDAPKLDEVVQASDGVTVFVDPKAVMFLIGAHMDFEGKLQRL